MIGKMREQKEIEDRAKARQAAKVNRNKKEDARRRLLDKKDSAFTVGDES